MRISQVGFYSLLIQFYNVFIFIKTQLSYRQLVEFIHKFCGLDLLFVRAITIIDLIWNSLGEVKQCLGFTVNLQHQALPSDRSSLNTLR